MPLEEQLSDDYIASLLAKDAKASNARYTAYGLQELLPKRPTYNAPKANTRFLKNIIKETDSHNAALRAKELADTRDRLRRLHGKGDTSNPGDRDGRLDREGNHRSKRRRVEEEYDPPLNRSRSIQRTPSERDRAGHSRSHRSHRRHHDDTMGSEADDDEDIRRDRRRHHHHRSRHERSRSRSPDRSSRKKTRHKISTLPSRSRSRSPSRDWKHDRRRPHHRSHSRRRKHKSPDVRTPFETARTFIGDDENIRFANQSHPIEQKRAPSPGSDSDPLEAIIGPPPPPLEPKVKARGRGTFAATSVMDSHFSSNYDPSADVQLEPEIDDDWDMALEALRDRQKWQKQGAERLKAAGFTEEEVQKWEKGGEKTEEDVRWKGRGEGREWDRGKVVGVNGVDTKPEWGRLKRT